MDTAGLLLPLGKPILFRGHNPKAMKVRSLWSGDGARPAKQGWDAAGRVERDAGRGFTHEPDLMGE